MFKCPTQTKSRQNLAFYRKFTFLMNRKNSPREVRFPLQYQAAAVRVQPSLIPLIQYRYAQAMLNHRQFSPHDTRKVPYSSPPHLFYPIFQRIASKKTARLLFRRAILLPSSVLMRSKSSFPAWIPVPVSYLMPLPFRFVFSL